MVTSSRLEAARELERIEADGAYIGLSRRDRSDRRIHEGKLTDLVAGVTRNRRWLDFLIDSFYSGDPVAMEARIRTVLRMGIYELLETRTPDYVVVNETVKCVKSLVGPRASGLVNGILRRVNRARSNLPQPDSKSPSEKLAIRHSHPTWMVDRWLTRYGLDDTVTLLAYNNQRPTFGIRRRLTDVNARSGLPPDDAISPSPFWDDFARVRSLRVVFEHNLIAGKAILVQDEAAGGVVKVLDPQVGDRVLDVCAAPGGKALYCAEKVGSSGFVLGVDQNESRLGMLASEAERLGLTHVEIRVSDIREFSDAELDASFDKVLVDAPCTGFGVLAKRADLRWRSSPEKLQELTRLQADILNASAKYVRKGGSLVYSTCTLEPEENEGQIPAFLRANSTFVVQSVHGLVPPELEDERGYYRSLPFRHGIDGAFAVKFIRGEPEGEE